MNHKNTLPKHSHLCIVLFGCGAATIASVTHSSLPELGFGYFLAFGLQFW